MGGAGFPTYRKWDAVRRQPNETKHVICNGDEGDPGAFMDRMLLESVPLRIIEGMAIAAYAVGAHEGILYIRAEYPLAVSRVRDAIRQCQERGILGESVMGKRFPFDTWKIKGGRRRVHLRRRDGTDPLDRRSPRNASAASPLSRPKAASGKSRR